MKIVELLNKSHNRMGFDCGSELLNRYLRQTAHQHIQKGISRTLVLVDSTNPVEIIGFFTLTLCQVQAEVIPLAFSKKYPAKLPGIKLARLAVAKQWQHQGIGQILMVEAMQRALLVAETAGGIGLFVDAKDDYAVNYYQRYGFVSLPDSPLEMFLSLSSISGTLDVSGKG